jgi:uncharacterized membrane protein
MTLFQTVQNFFKELKSGFYAFLLSIRLILLAPGFILYYSFLEGDRWKISFSLIMCCSLIVAGVAGLGLKTVLWMLLIFVVLIPLCIFTVLIYYNDIRPRAQNLAEMQ